MYFQSSLRPMGLCAALLALTLSTPLGATTLDKALAQAQKNNNAAKTSQTKVDGIDDETAELAAEYRALVEQIESLQRYNGQVSKLLQSQRDEMNSLQGQINRVVGMQRELVPLMEDMLSGLSAFVELDVPFLQEERTTRIGQLEALMNRADVTNAEKFRRLLEAYQLENEYGRTIEAYTGKLPGADETSRTVNFLRIGRVVLAYQTLDGEELGVWNSAKHAFEPLGADYRNSISKGFRIANKQAPPDLIRLPVWLSEEVK